MGEVPANVQDIRDALLDYHAAFDVYLETDFQPRSVAALDRRHVDWKTDTAFETLGWSPDWLVYGVYRVTVTDGGDDFLVEGWTLRGRTPDGKVSYYHATSEGEVHSAYLDWPLDEEDYARGATPEPAELSLWERITAL